MTSSKNSPKHSAAILFFAAGLVAAAAEPRWSPRNLSAGVEPSYCYADDAKNCKQYGRLYTWDSAQRACASLGKGWRLPTDEEWHALARRHGGVSADKDGDGGLGAYRELLAGGTAKFNAVLGGNRNPGGTYGRLGAHGFYWTATEAKDGMAIFYNFGKGQLKLHRQLEGEKALALSVRCVRE